MKKILITLFCLPFIGCFSGDSQSESNSRMTEPSKEQIQTILHGLNPTVKLEKAIAIKSKDFDNV